MKKKHTNSFHLYGRAWGQELSEQARLRNMTRTELIRKATEEYLAKYPLDEEIEDPAWIHNKEETEKALSEPDELEKLDLICEGIVIGIKAAMSTTTKTRNT